MNLLNLNNATSATDTNLDPRDAILHYLTMDHFRWYSMGTVPHMGGTIGEIYCCYGGNNNLLPLKYEQNELISKTFRQNGVFESWFGEILEEFAQNNPSGYRIEMGTGLGDSWRLLCFRRTCDRQLLGTFKTDDLSGWSLEQLRTEAQTVMMFDSAYLKMRKLLVEKLL